MKKTKVKRKAPIKLTKPIRNDYIRRMSEIIKLAPLSATIKKFAEEKWEEPKTEITVRNVYHDGQYLPALCFRETGANASKIVACLAGDRIEGIRVFSIDPIAHDKAAVVMHGPGEMRVPYPIERFLAFMNKLASDGAPVTGEALQAMQRALYPFPVARPHALASATAAPEPRPATDARPGPQNAPSEPVRKRSGANRTDGKQLIYELSREFGLPPEKVRAKLRASGLRAPYTNPDSCRKAMFIPDKPKKPRKRK